MILRRLLPSLALFLSGCASTFQGYPSLAKRAIEDAPIAEVSQAPSPVAPEPELVRNVDRLTAQAQAGGAAFDKAWPEADRVTRAAAGSAVSSEAWVAAQTALSTLETARNDSVSALASLDVLYVERSNAVSEGKVGGGIDAIDAARGAALAIVDSQNDRLDVLKGRLAQP
ncbi:hypothetical protein NUH86_07480 [Sphingobium sp. JS3065]|uniref:hypothetical protein n=1 Tax=Sphingobium sp. JS3065 TaxID=2970925 RepID=UPI002264FA5C|nr:hypothetical protein [Sphingobium sp. JS3065]UZW56585.1 hypothetical protein NUH86_07480 [Sphingobium sp. JS3065]